MADDYGLWTGVGAGLNQFGQALAYRGQKLEADREKQADKFETDARNIATNIAQMGGPNAPGVADLVQQLHRTVTMHNALYPPHETPALIARIGRFLGKPPGPPRIDERATMTPEQLMAAAPRTQTSQTQDLQIRFQQAKQVLKQAHPDWTDAQINQRAIEYLMPEKTAGTKLYRGPNGETEYFAPGDEPEGWNAVAPGTGGSFNIPKAIPDPISKEPVGITYQGQSWYKNQMANAPEAVQNAFSQLTQAHQTAVQEKQKSAQDMANLRFRNQQELVRERFNNQLDLRDFTTATKSINDEQKAVDLAEQQRNVMRKSLVEAVDANGNIINQQAVVNLVANHLGMTAGQQKGIRITQTLWSEATSSAPWLDTVLARFGLSYEGKTWDEFLPQLLNALSTGGLSGVTVPPQSLNQMVQLGEDRFNEMSRQLEQMKVRYQDVTKLRPTQATTPTGAGAQGKIRVEWKDPATGQVHTGTVDADKFDPNTMTRIGAQ